MPKSLNEQKELLAAEVEESFFCASGPGGQHRNRTETGVRIKHIPTGITVTATERRSQAQNRDEAWKRLLKRIAAQRVRPKKRIPTRPTRASKAKRIDDKKRRGLTKKSRQNPTDN
ncbi:MAG TPA: peptide chain release factor-like protein [Planctomycetes bacterium]|nr:peptide chain release factor-like protein [Planctomycetota bacterium]